MPFRASQAEYLLDRVVDIEGPLLVQEGLINSYKLYKIKTKKADATSFDTSVSRRFSDFEYLHHSLLEDYGGCVIPKLPKKSVLAKFNLESNDFREDRVRHLRKYLTELLKHVRIRCCRQLRLFLFG